MSTDGGRCNECGYDYGTHDRDCSIRMALIASAAPLWLWERRP